MATTELEGLVDEWCDLVVKKGFERQPGQVAKIIREFPATPPCLVSPASCPLTRPTNPPGDLGYMPPVDKPFDRALWVAALINPLPALGVALEIRPAVLQAASTANALSIVTAGIRGSIGHVSGEKPLF